MRFLERLAAGDTIPEPIAIVVAHPDDEVLWAAGALLRAERATLIHLTDGAPADMADAARLGFARRADYAAARARELNAALATLRVDPVRIGYGLTDQRAADDLAWLVARLRQDLAGMAAVITHPYEGGHPDHDAAAFAVARAAPDVERIEFACYPTIDGARAFGRFWPDESRPERMRLFADEERQRVAAAVSAHATQAHVTGSWRPLAERWRHAPDYDFTAPPPPGVALYDGFGWSMTSSLFRERAREALGLVAG